MPSGWQLLSAGLSEGKESNLSPPEHWAWVSDIIPKGDIGYFMSVHGHYVLEALAEIGREDPEDACSANITDEARASLFAFSAACRNPGEGKKALATSMNCEMFPKMNAMPRELYAKQWHDIASVGFTKDVDLTGLKAFKASFNKALADACPALCKAEPAKDCQRGRVGRRSQSKRRRRRRRRREMR
eukprot:6021227-Pyramimonas_sp.AAC.1